MDTLYIKKTESSPEIILDAKNNSYKLTGESRPENIRKFYDPVFNWFKTYFLELQKNSKNVSINLEINFEYFNTSTAKMIYDLIMYLNNECKALSGDFKVTWKHDALDDDIRESGKELQKFTGVSFDFIKIE